MLQPIRKLVICLAHENARQFCHCARVKRKVKELLKFICVPQKVTSPRCFPARYTSTKNLLFAQLESGFPGTRWLGSMVMHTWLALKYKPTMRLVDPSKEPVQMCKLCEKICFNTFRWNRILQSIMSPKTKKGAAIHRYGVATSANMKSSRIIKTVNICCSSQNQSSFCCKTTVEQSCH